MRNNIIHGILCAILLLFSSSLYSATISGTALAKFREVKVLAEGEAQIVKTRNARTNPDYVRVQMAYTRAHAKYAGLVAAMAQAVRDGNAPAFEKDPKTKELVAEAESAANKYFQEVDLVLEQAQTKSPVATIAMLSNVMAVIKDMLDGFEKTQGVADKYQAQRAAQADRLEKQIGWLSWDEIKAETKENAKK